MDISSPAFADHELIPQRFTCEGEDVSPPLVFADMPDQTITLALIMDDPDAPSGTFDHWIVWDIPPITQNLPEGAPLPNQGRNGFGVSRYRGPCPPPGKTHRYIFKLYALEKQMKLPVGSSKQDLEQSMKGHILDQAVLIGLYQR